MSTTLKQLTDQAIADRRHLHQHPELSWQEFETSRFIRKRLNDINIDILEFDPPSVVGFLKGTKGDKTIALRADIDALPITEEGDKPYISKRKGIAHVCGHDGHTAILLAVAKHLAEHRDDIEHHVKFIFQTSEELIPSGAEHLVENGVLDGVDAVFGLHVWQGLDKGKIGLAHGPMMASADDFEITIEGKGGHGSMPHETVDPIYIASHLIQGLQSIVSRQTDAGEPKVITVGEIKAGSNYNIIPDTATLRGTVHTNIKIKVGTDPQIDIERIRAVRRAIPNHIKLRVDANQGWSVTGAIHVIEQTKDCIVEWYEQPIKAGHHEAMAEIRKATHVNIMADESIHSVRDLLTLIQCQGADLVNIKLMKTGGIYPALALAHLADAAEMPCQVGSMVESAIATMAGAHLALSQSIIQSKKW